MVEMVKWGALCFLGLTILSSCTAERFEPQVKGIDGAEARLQLRAEIASDLNDRIDQVAAAVDQLTNASNQLLALFPELKSHVNAHSLKTLALALSSLKNGLGTDENDRFLRTARVRLDFLSPTDPCSQVELLVDGRIQDAALGEEVQLLARTCGSDDYQPFLSLRALGSQGQKFNLNMAPFEALFGSTISQVQVPPECEVEVSDEFALDYLKCSDIRVFANKNFELKLESIVLDQRSSTQPVPLSIQMRLRPYQPDSQCQIFKGWVDTENRFRHSNSQIPCEDGRRE